MMPKPSIWMIRISLLCLLISATIGGLVFVNKAVNIHPAIWALLPLHYELAIWGWLVQFVMGTAYWMFPKKLEGEKRGPVSAAWAMAVLFNLGLMFLVTASASIGCPWAAGAGRGLIAASIVLFMILMWQRVVSYRHLEEMS